MENSYTNEMIKVGKMIYSFALINRADLLPDGKTQESDTDHTILLSVIACSIADSLYKNKLDIGLVSQFAMVHDLVEVYAGDVVSFGLTEEEKKIKEAKEKDSIITIKNEFDVVFPWISRTIEFYESQNTKEARFVKILDRYMPKIRHVLNNGAFFKNNNISKEEVKDYFTKQSRDLFEKHQDEFPELFIILSQLNEMVLEESYV